MPHQASLSECDREPIHIAGAIQPHGVLLALDPDSLKIVQAAGDTQKLLGAPPRELLGESLRASLGATSLLRLESLLSKDEVLPRPFFVFEVSFGSTRLDVTAHLSGGLIVLELEPQQGIAPGDPLVLVQTMISRLRSQSMSDFLDSVVREVRQVTGYDRAMIYRFDPDNSGHVIAESLASPRIASFLDLHYPASDIPSQARALYARNWIRCIPDTIYDPAPIVPPTNPKTGGPLDLSFSSLRSVSPVHLEYLGNMGVRASISLSLVVDGRLWGMIVCHAETARHLDCRTRGALELFAQLTSMQLRTLLELESSFHELRAREIHAAFTETLAASGVSRKLLDQHPNLLDLIPASGALIRLNGINMSLGDVPEDRYIDALVQWLNQSIHEGVYATDRLIAAYPPAVEFSGKAAGLIALSISRQPRDYVMWFLPEVARTVTWAGNPDKPVAVDGARISPRKSFEAWQQVTKGCSRPWRTFEIEAARRLRVSILETVVKWLDEIVRERDNARRQQDLLLRELDHRAKNTIATIQALVRASGRTADDLASYVSSLEQRLLSMGRAYSLLNESRWTGASVRTLIEEELAPFRSSEKSKVLVDGPDCTIDSQASLSLALALHELTMNAVKHGGLSVPEGTVSVAWRETIEQNRHVLKFDWIERNGPPVNPPKRRGFGRTLIENIFAQDVQGRIDLAFNRDGVSCVIEIPRERMVREAEVETNGSALPGVASTRAPGTGARVLVVEDNALIAIDTTEALREGSFIVLGPYARLEDALQAALHEVFDVALLDVNLDGTPVWPVAAAITGRNIPFLFTTGYSEGLRYPSEFKDVHVVRKPFQRQDLFAGISKVMQRASHVQFGA